MNIDAKILKKILANWESQKSEPVIGSSGGSGSERVSAASQNPAQMSLYLSPEDLKVDKMIQAQAAFSVNPANPAILSEASAPVSPDGNLCPKLYPEFSQ